MLSGVAALIGVLYLFGLFELVRDPERARAALEGLGMWAPVLYVLSFAALEPFFVPALAFIIPGAVVFSFPTLFLLSWLASVGAGIVGFSFARFLGRDFVETRLPKGLHRYDRRLATKGLQTVILIRLTLFLAPPAHWLLGLSQVRFSSFVIGSALGFIPGIALLTYLVVFVGETLGDWIADRPPGFFLGIVILVIVAMRLGRYVERRRARAKETLAEGASETGGTDRPG
ncbi:MAG: TVP38/TMEM64 family protein [bacterium]|nr:TVP38/TMEM64 family protein [bacterium]